MEKRNKSDPLKQETQCIKKLDPRGVRQPSGIVLKMKTFSCRSRKPPNLCPTHTQQHCSSREIGLALDLCFGVGHTPSVPKLFHS
jgi:hypothetical protein